MLGSRSLWLICLWIMTFSKRRHGETSKPGQKKPGSHPCLYDVECIAGRACRVLGQSLSTQRHIRKVTEDEEDLVEGIIELACQYGRYGSWRITALLRAEGWKVNHKRVERIWRQEGLKVPKKQPKKGCLWLTDGSCIRLRPEKKDHVWSYDFSMIRTTDGRPVRILVIIDEYTRECLSLKVARRLRF